MKEREREKGEKWWWGGSGRVKERWRGGGEVERKEKKSLAKKKQRKGTKREKEGKREGQIGRRADCRVSSCKINGGMLSFFFTGISSSCYGNRPKPAGLFLKTSPVLQVHRDRPQIVSLEEHASLSCHETNELCAGFRNNGS